MNILWKVLEFSFSEHIAGATKCMGTSRLIMIDAGIFLHTVWKVLECSLHGCINIDHDPCRNNLEYSVEGSRLFLLQHIVGAIQMPECIKIDHDQLQE